MQNFKMVITVKLFLEQIQKIEKLNENVEIKMVKQASVIKAFSKLDWEIKRRGHDLKAIEKGHTILIPTNTATKTEY